MIRKTAIITGGSGGIGSATALKFAQNGYNIGITYNKNHPKELIAKIKSFGVDCFAVKVDQNKAKDISKAIESFNKHSNRIDCLVCNAGIAEKEELLIDKKDSEIEEILNVNLKGTILFNREVLKLFIKQKYGTIVNVSSILGKVGCACESVYSASKAGLIGFTRALSKEVGEYGIRVNAVAPGMINTKMIECFSEGDKKELINATSLRRLGEPEDVADVVAFLASEMARFVTGECIEVSGGLLI